MKTNIPSLQVIFRHKAASFKLASRLRRDALYIKEPDLTNEESAIAFYTKELKRVENSNKSFIVMNYNPIIGGLFRSLLNNPNTFEYKNWSFITFFHDDHATLSLQSRKIPDIIEEKVNILLDMLILSCMRRLIIPFNYEITLFYMLGIMLDERGMVDNSNNKFFREF